MDDKQAIIDINDAIERDDPVVTTKLLKCLPHLLRRDIGGTWLHRAAANGSLECVKALVSLGLSPSEPKPDDPYVPEGPVYDAVIEAHIHVVKWLLEHGANSNCTVNGVVRNFALSSAVSNGHFDIVELLVEHGADVNATWAGMNALTNSYAQPEIYDYLRAHGAREPAEIAGIDTTKSHQDILEHITRHIGKPQPLAQQQIVENDPKIAIHVVPASAKERHVTLVTTGMSDRAMTVPPLGGQYRYAELFMDLPTDWPTTAKKLAEPRYAWTLAWLRKIAHHPHDNKTWLGGRATIIDNGEPPEPLAKGVPFTCILLLAEAGKFGQPTLPDRRWLQFYRDFPIYTEERDLERKVGITELIKLFEKHKISSTFDPKRKNVATLRGK